MDRLPLSVQTLYAELLTQLTEREAAAHGGSFVEKTVGGQVYVYLQVSEPGGAKRQHYLGRQTPALEALVASRRAAIGRESIDLLARQLRAGGLRTADAAASRVLAALAAAGVFRLGGVLVGTYAYVALGGLLGVSWRGGLFRTEDVDVAGKRRLDVAVPPLETDVPGALEALQMGFLPVPALDPRRPSTSFKVRGKALRLDLLTPGREGEGPVPIPRLRAAAQPLPFLELLLDVTEPAVVIDGGAVLVRVPDPARFALHKLIVAASRPVAMQTKAGKDLAQAADLIEALAQDRPADLIAAWQDVARRGRRWTRRTHDGLALLAARHPEAAEALRPILRDV